MWRLKGEGPSMPEVCHVHGHIHRERVPLSLQKSELSSTKYTFLWIGLCKTALRRAKKWKSPFIPSQKMKLILFVKSYSAQTENKTARRFYREKAVLSLRQMTYVNSGKCKSSTVVVVLERGEKAKVSVGIKSNIGSYKGTTVGRLLFGCHRR